MVCTIFTTTYTAPLGHNESVQKKKILNLSDILDVKITHLSLLILPNVMDLQIYILLCLMFIFDEYWYVTCQIEQVIGAPWNYSFESNYMFDSPSIKISQL